MGPIAPKDPVRKRDFYYIMLEKQISVSPAQDGKSISYLYQSDGRLISSSKIVGNISDQSMLDLLKTTEGFRKLIYGIGVSMQCQPMCEGDFVFQMYGKTDPYVTGTSIRQHISGDGVEYLIPLSEVVWSDDDKEPGQIRFEFPVQDVNATVNVRFYLNDGYKAPLFEGLDKVDTSSEAYRQLIRQSVLSTGNTYRLHKALDRAKAGEKIELAFIGGSITQGAGGAPLNTECYAYKTYQGLCSLTGNENIGYIKAGVGGTPSELGMIRYDRDVLCSGSRCPDIVVVEFAVNDAGDETGGDCYEGLVRRILLSPEAPAVVLLFSVFADDYTLEDRLIPIGRNYDLPMVSLKSAVTAQFYKSKAEGRVMAKNTYFYDCYHPTNIGHTVMADCLTELFDMVMKADADKSDIPAAAPIRSADFEDIHLFDRLGMVSRPEKHISPEFDDAFRCHVSSGSFAEVDEDLQRCEMNLDAVGTAEFPNNWYKSESGNDPFVMDVTCSKLVIVIKDSSSPSYGKADVFADGRLVKTIDPREVGWTHCNPQIIIREQKIAPHHVEVRMHEGDEDKKFTILGFGIS